jgi:hypothetical protein
MKPEQALKLIFGSCLVYAIFAACGGGGSGGKGGHDGSSPVPDAMADVNQSGTRLKAQYYAGVDGSKAFAGMYDTTLKQDCAYAVAADGKSRCLPAGPRVIASTTYYSDAACKQPILNVPKTCTTPPPYVSTFDASCGGATTFHVYPSGAAFTPGTDIYFGGGKNCTKIKPTAGADWVSTGGELAATMFVEGNLLSE